MGSVQFQTQTTTTNSSRVDVKVHRLVRPDGRPLHVAASPEEALRLRRTLSAEEHGDIVMHGSEEHTGALRRMQTQYMDRCSTLRQHYGDLFEEFDSNRAKLDDVAKELEAAMAQELALDANFSKFGYSATIRAFDSSQPQSSASSVSGESLAKSYQARITEGVAMELFRVPVVRQYFHKGIIWRAPESEEVRSYELFFDLIYVGIIAISGDSTAEDANGAGLLRFATTFLMGWKIWSDVIQMVAWFDAEDIFRRLNILFVLVLLLGLTTNIYLFSDETFTPAVAFYVAARIDMGLVFALYGWLIPMVRSAMVGQIILVVIPVALWIGSIYVENPQRQVLVWIALTFDIFANNIVMIAKRLLENHKSERVRNWFEFYPALNIEHRIERTNAFVSLVFGYSVVSLLYQAASRDPLTSDYFWKAALGLIQAFVFSWLYFEIDFFNLHTHAIRRHSISAVVWLGAHIPFILSFVLASAALARLVLTHDTESIDLLAEVSAQRSDAEIATGLRWFYCAGLGIALLSMSVIGETHEFKSIKYASSLAKIITRRKRLKFRAAVGIVFICLSICESLNSLQLIAITTTLSSLCLALELFANTLLCEERRRAKGCGRRKCQYVARCRISKNELDQGIKDGAISTIAELDGEKGPVYVT